MPKRKPPEVPEEPELAVSREEASTRIKDRIEKGKELQERTIGSEAELEKARAELTKWSQYNSEMLKRLFTTGALAEEYNRFFGSMVRINPTSTERVAKLKEDVADGMKRLESILERLELYDDPPGAPAPSTSPTHRPFGSTNRVFVVHGHDEAARETVARFLERLGLEAVILHEQASGGRTLIEKLEHYAGVGFAIVLLTPDDVGAASSAPGALQPRARQNVVLELGYFVALLGRANVCALYKGPLELPSDYLGVAYVAMDASVGWHLQLARELRAAGFAIDTSRLL